MIGFIRRLLPSQRVFNSFSLNLARVWRFGDLTFGHKELSVDCCKQTIFWWISESLLEFYLYLSSATEMDASDSDEGLIKKEIVYPGTKFIPFTDGTRVSDNDDVELPFDSQRNCSNNLNVLSSGEIPLSNTNMPGKWRVCGDWWQQEMWWPMHGVGHRQEIQIRSVGSDCAENVSERSGKLSCSQIGELVSGRAKHCYHSTIRLLLPVGRPVSIHCENIAWRWQAARRTKALLWHDDTERRDWIQWSWWIVRKTVRLGIHHRWVERIIQTIQFHSNRTINVSTEIISIERPTDYEKESWQLSDTEKTAAITRLREDGNELYRKGQTEKAEEKYKSALGMIEQLLMK